MPGRQQTLTAVTEIFHNATFPGGQAGAGTAWAGVYQALLWYEPLAIIPGRTGLPHIIDANRLTLPLRLDGRLRVWQSHAIRVEKHIAQQWGVEAQAVQGMVDRLMRLPTYHGLQRHNLVGSAFPGLVRLVLELFGDPIIAYELEVRGEDAFPGVRLPTRTEEPYIDILVRKSGRNIAIISTKWSLRHDRINDLTSECRAYKGAARFTDTKILYYVATNEFDPARTEKLLTDKCIDGLVHVHKPLVTEVCALDRRLAEMLDLSQLVQSSHNW